jgi:hypothetical protein
MSLKNSINLLICRRRWSGKTFNLSFKMIKLEYIPNFGGYTCFIISDTPILNDDTINGYKRKENAALEELLFMNRQPTFTILICCQDSYTISIKIRRNLDILWLFGCFKTQLCRRIRMKRWISMMTYMYMMIYNLT